MKILRSPGHPYLYFVEGAENWYAIRRWMTDNEVSFIQESSVGGLGKSTMTIGFSISKNAEWFALKWGA